MSETKVSVSARPVFESGKILSVEKRDAGSGGFNGGQEWAALVRTMNPDGPTQFQIILNK